MNNDKFIVVDHEYYNSGGNCMLSIFQVYDVDANATRYCICGDDSFSWQTANTIYNEFLQLDCEENINKLVLGSWCYSALTSDPSFDMHQFTNEQWEMFKYCQFEHYKKDCKHFDIKVNIPIDELPPALYNTLTDDYKDWAKENDWYVDTDGEQVFLNESYVAPEDKEQIDEDRIKVLKDIRSFTIWYESLQYAPYRDDINYITIAVAGDSVKIPFHADTYELLSAFLKDVIKDF